uniref:Uncharacterized protein n=1 Tax=Arundo donax TaxID=35708 RepID=A0A0A9GX28_ARUDO
MKRDTCLLHIRATVQESMEKRWSTETLFMGGIHVAQITYFSLGLFITSFVIMIYALQRMRRRLLLIHNQQSAMATWEMLGRRRVILMLPFAAT